MVEQMADLMVVLMAVALADSTIVLTAEKTAERMDDSTAVLMAGTKVFQTAD